MTESLLRQSIIDEEHLKLLSLGYMVSAAMTAFTSVLGLWFIFMGAILTASGSAAGKFPSKNGQPPPAFIGWILGGVGLIIFLFLLAFAALKLKAAFCIRQRKSRTFCMVVAAITCLGVPYGTALGVFTFIVVGRESVSRLFATSAPAAAIPV